MTVAQIIAVSVLAVIVLAVLWNTYGHSRHGDDNWKADYGATDTSGPEAD